MGESKAAVSKPGDLRGGGVRACSHCVRYTFVAHLIAYNQYNFVREPIEQKQTTT